MTPTAKSIVPDLLRETQAAADSPRKPVRILVCGIPDGVESIIHRLYLEGFAQISEWSQPLPSPIAGEIIRVITRYYSG